MSKKLSLYITGGYPDIDTFQNIVLTLSKAGADILEIGIPYSDPIADGEVIQNSSLIALNNNITILDIARSIKSIRNNINSEIYFMSYYNPVFVFGENRFIKLCKESGIDGVIIPDLPYEEGKEFYKNLITNNIKTTLLVTTVTPMDRIKKISKLTTGFLYLVSVLGTTGARDKLPITLKNILKNIKNNINNELFLGFGIKNPDMVTEFQNYLDGVIVGSALIELINKNIEKKSLLNKKLREFVNSFKRELS